MVWAGICYGQNTPLVFIEGNLKAQRYIDVILHPVVVPFIRRHNVTLEKDNARACVARLTLDYLRQNNVDWPPYNADMSPTDILDTFLGHSR